MVALEAEVGPEGQTGRWSGVGRALRIRGERRRQEDGEVAGRRMRRTGEQVGPVVVPRLM